MGEEGVGRVCVRCEGRICATKRKRASCARLKRKPVRKGCGAIRCSCMACDLGGHAIRSFYSARVVEGRQQKGCRHVQAWAWCARVHPNVL